MTVDPLHIVVALFLASFLLAMAAVYESNACHKRNAEIDKARKREAKARREAMSR